MDVRDLIDIKNGTASREIFVDRDVYRQEQEQIFSRAWLFVGHECQVPKPDDFYVSRMGEESVILTRDRQGKLHVFLNSCRHRGMKLCRYDEGNTRVFSCPYHAWSYSTDGDLVSIPGELFGVPGYKKYYHEELDKKEWGLVSVAQMVNYRGTIWATWDAKAAPFEDYLGGMRLWLDSARPEVADELQLEVPRHQLRWRRRTRRQPPIGRHGQPVAERRGRAA
jgi:phenylpropionate dioxygenase-like ring-hydroxylating dioxygenase large terminal subunit